MSENEPIPWWLKILLVCLAGIYLLAGIVLVGGFLVLFIYGLLTSPAAWIVLVVLLVLLGFGFMVGEINKRDTLHPKQPDKSQESATLQKPTIARYIFKPKPKAQPQEKAAARTQNLERRWIPVPPPKREMVSYEEVVQEEESYYREGGQRDVWSKRYERSAKVRQLARHIHGRKCKVCGFDFDVVYGEKISRGYIEIHHITPLSESGAREIDIYQDVAPVCANCHRVIHRRQPPYSVDELKKKLQK